ncbi:MAG: alpha/beta fold hydrolase [Proteobacteria bacterium]|nr:alpha/beta fold hydrolase [Pseudomonadota bacterium]
MTFPDSPLDHVTPYDRFAWSDAQIEQWLASGEQRAELSAYFGATEHRQLATLARRARDTAVRDPGLRVIIVPGIMGSQLGLLRPAPLPHDLLWLDPIDIQRGRLAALRLPGGAPIVPLGIVTYSYLRLKLALRAQGLAAEFHDYDWRLPVGMLGGDLAQRIRAAAPQRVALVAHSMGGLVSRAALAHPGTAQVRSVVLLGTPNHGSFAAIQALRGTYAVVRKIARLALRSSAEDLAAQVFNTFPSLYDFLPDRDGGAGMDLFDAGNWPVSGPQPRPALLAAASTARAQLAPVDERFTAIAGIGQVTATGVARRGDDFVYTLTRAGDGTVPAASAAPRGVRTLYVRAAHSDLTRDWRVAQAVAGVLRGEARTALAARWRNRSRARAQVSDNQLRASHTGKVDWGAFTAQERRSFLENLNEPPRLLLRVARRGSRRGNTTRRGVRRSP